MLVIPATGKATKELLCVPARGWSLAGGPGERPRFAMLRRSFWRNSEVEQMISNDQISPARNLCPKVHHVLIISHIYILKPPLPSESLMTHRASPCDKPCARYPPTEPSTEAAPPVMTTRMTRNSSALDSVEIMKLRTTIEVMHYHALSIYHSQQFAKMIWLVWDLG